MSSDKPQTQWQMASSPLWGHLLPGTKQLPEPLPKHSFQRSPHLSDSCCHLTHLNLLPGPQSLPWLSPAARPFNPFSCEPYCLQQPASLLAFQRRPWTGLCCPFVSVHGPMSTQTRETWHPESPATSRVGNRMLPCVGDGFHSRLRATESLLHVQLA